MLPWMVLFLSCGPPPSDSARGGDGGRRALVVGLQPTSPRTTDDLVLSLQAAEGDWDWWWYQDDELRDDLVGDTVPASETARGQTWRVRVGPAGGRGEEGVVEASTTILNSPPEAMVHIEPAAPTTEQDLEARVEGSDADEDALSWTYRWTVDGLDSEHVGARLPARLTRGGENWQVQATPADEVEAGEPAWSDPVAIANSAPTLGRVQLVPEEVYETSTVACVPEGFADADGDPPSYGYSWRVNGVERGTEQTLDGASFDRGDELQCVVQPWDGVDPGEAVHSPAVQVRNSPPSASAAWLSTTSPAEADVLSVSLTDPLDADGDPVEAEVHWWVDGVEVSTEPSLSGEHFDKGQRIVARVRPTDGIDAGAELISDEAMAINTPPELAAVELGPGELYTDDVLVSSVSVVDPDPGDSVELAYRWRVNGGLLPVLEPQLDGALHFDKHDEIQLEVEPYDGEETGPSLSSALVMVRNSPPTAPVVEITPEDPLVGTEDLLCMIQEDATDPDGDALSYVFGWELDGGPYGGAISTYEPGDTIHRDDLGAEDSWRCLVHAVDDEEPGPQVSDEMFLTDEVFRFTGPAPINLLVISLDTTRRDRIGRFSGLGTTPFLDERLAEAVVLEDHRSCSSWTYPSTTCVQTGLFPPAHGWWPGSYMPEIPEQPSSQQTLQDALSVAGYRSALATSNDYISPWYPHGRGFDEVSMQSWLPASYVADGGLALAADLATSGQPWYLHMHFVDPHGEYNPPYPYDQGREALDPIPWDMDNYYGIWDAAAAWPTLTEFQQEKVQAHVDALYHGELMYWDSVLEDTWNTLDAMGMLEDTLVVFWTDHGEQFMERGGGFSHGLNLFAEENRSTAAFWAKNLEHRAVPLPTIHQDLAPTILDLLSVPSLHAMDGQRLDDIEMDRARRAFLVWNWTWAELMVEQDKRQLNYWWNGEVSYHDNERDPFNYDDLYDPSDPDVQAMISLMNDYISDLESSLPGLGAPTVSW